MTTEPAPATPTPYPFNEACRIGLQLSTISADAGERIGSTARAMEAALATFPDIESIQIPVVEDPGECRQVESIAGSKNLRLNLTLNRIQQREGITLIGRDDNGRFQAVERLKPFFEKAKASGAGAVTVYPGPNNDDPEERLVDLGSLEGCLAELAVAARDLGGLHLLIESMDTGADKKRLLGKTLEAIAMAARIRQKDLPFGLIADTAHMFLNGERVIDGVQMHDMFMDELHLANAIITRGHPLAGDRHPPFGEPGFFTESWLKEAFFTWRRFGLFAPGSDLVVVPEIQAGAAADAAGTLSDALAMISRCWDESFKATGPADRNPLEDDEPLFPPEG